MRPIRQQGVRIAGCYHLLSNRIYRGMIVHKGESFAGEHEPIIPLELWDAVQAKFKANASGTSRRLRSQQPSLLVGLVFDGEGRAMTPSHATKPGKRYRYYVPRSDQLDDAPAWRVSAHDLERLVCNRLSELLMDHQFLCDFAADSRAEVIRQVLANADLVSANLRSGAARERAALLPTMITRIDLHEDGIDLTIERSRLGAALGLDTIANSAERLLLLTMATTKVRRGHQLRLVIPGPQTIAIAQATRDDKLVALMAEAYQARQLILAGPDQSIAAIAASTNRCRTRLGKLAALSCLAPDIVTAIVEGRQPATLNARSLQDIDLPTSWPDQRALLGFG